MTVNRNQLAYQEAAVGNANPIELVIMLYDVLARDLHGAIEAMEAGNIELRCRRRRPGRAPSRRRRGDCLVRRSRAGATRVRRVPRAPRKAACGGEG